jgi:hypothetical protein
MANEQEKFQQATESAEKIEAECKVRMDALQARLAAASYEGQKAEIQKEIDKLKKVFDRAIDRAKLDQTKAEAEYLVQKKDQEERVADQRATQKQEIKNHALREFIKAGGDPNQFEAAWPSIEQSILNERVISALLGKTKSDTTIKL